MARWLPRGAGLEHPAWQARHRAISALLWAHVALLPVVALLRGETVLHALFEGAAIAWLAAGALVRAFPAMVRSAFVTLGLLTSSAILVHLFDGLIEMHFHFFVVVAVVALYQAWGPFLLALGFVLVHHGLLGTLMPETVYNHPAALAHPGLWAVVHGGFVLAESVACLAYWRMTEDALTRERDARLNAVKAHEELIRAQELSEVGSWDWDVASGVVTWSEQLYALFGVDPATFTPTVDSFLELVHADDRPRVASLLEAAALRGGGLDYECRFPRPDGTVRMVHARSDVVLDADGVVTHMRGTCHDITERTRMQEEIAHLAFHDALTGLANRRLFVARLEAGLEQAVAARSSTAVLFVDLDRFKAINDSFGHAVGDSVLVEVARRLARCVREQDTVARLGGDEFAILCTETGRAEAHRMADRITVALCGPATVEGASLVLAASIGIAVADGGGPAGDDAADDLLREADAAMYVAKTRSKDGGTPATSARLVGSSKTGD